MENLHAYLKYPYPPCIYDLSVRDVKETLHKQFLQCFNSIYLDDTYAIDHNSKSLITIGYKAIM